MTYAEIVEWVVKQTNRLSAQFDGAAPRSRIDVSIAGGHAFLCCSPGFRIDRNDLVYYVEADTVRQITEALTK